MKSVEPPSEYKTVQDTQIANVFLTCSKNARIIRVRNPPFVKAFSRYNVELSLIFEGWMFHLGNLALLVPRAATAPHSCHRLSKPAAFRRSNN